MRPENSSKLWLKTFCDWSRASTLLSSVTPVKPGCDGRLRNALGRGFGLEVARARPRNCRCRRRPRRARAAGGQDRAPRARGLRRERREIVRWSVSTQLAIAVEISIGTGSDNVGVTAAKTRRHASPLADVQSGRPTIDRRIAGMQSPSVMTYASVLAPPREQVGREIRRRACARDGAAGRHAAAD